MVDPVRLGRLLQRVREETEALGRLAERDEHAPLDDDGLAAVKYRFIVAIEATIDAGQHVISSEGLPVPESFAEVFDVLADSGHLPRELSEQLRGMAGFRNLLVHGYARVDDERVRTILGTRLDDFARFREALATQAGQVAD